MQTYTLKQLVGGFLILAVFIIIFSINLTYKSDLNLKMLFNPILIALAICMIMYIINLNETIKRNKNKLATNDDKFTFKTCPVDYKHLIERDNSQNIIFEKCEGDIDFNLDGNKQYCTKTDNGYDEGCFNKYSLREKKCEKVKNFFTNENGLESEVLSKWTEYRNNCTF